MVNTNELRAHTGCAWGMVCARGCARTAVGCVGLALFQGSDVLQVVPRRQHRLRPLDLHAHARVPTNMCTAALALKLFGRGVALNRGHTAALTLI